MTRPACRPAVAVVLGLSLVLTGCSAGSPAPEPTGIDGVRLVEGLSSVHRDGDLDYDAVPPVGGDHNERWLACEAYAQPVPEEFAVHSMEHGGVWLAHRPDLPAADVARLTALREMSDTTQEYVLVSPLEGLPGPVVAATWGASLAVDSADDLRLRAFVERYAGGGQGGEEGAPCRTGGVTPEQARGLLQQG